MLLMTMVEWVVIAGIMSRGKRMVVLWHVNKRSSVYKT